MSSAVVAPPRVRSFTPLVGAVVFLVCYLAVSPITDAIASLPLPDAPTAEVYAYFTDHGAASIVTGILQLLSVAGFAVLLAAVVRLAPTGRHARAFGMFGWIAVAAMVVCCAIAIVLPLVAPSLSPESVDAWRQASFYTGGVVHIMALGGSALAIALCRAWTRPVWVMSWIAAVPAILSLASVFWYYASILLPAGRVLAMIAFVAAGVSIARGRSLSATEASRR